MLLPSAISEIAAAIALVRSGGRPWHHYAELIEDAGSARAALDDALAQNVASEQGTLLPADVTPRTADLAAIEDEIQQWQAEGIRLLTVLDADYPDNLRTIHNRPPLLFVRGQLRARDERAVAVVGTRRASKRGLANAARIAGDIADAGWTVLSGLAAGVDTAVHQAALERRGRTVAVIGTGLRRVYPAANADLQRRIANEAAVVSQFWPDAPPTRRSFPLRNVVMSGLALATVVIEASHTSGAKMQARLALEHGRPVFLLDTLMEYEWARDYAGLPGTHVVQRADEVMQRLERLSALDSLVP